MKIVRLIPHLLRQSAERDLGQLQAKLGYIFQREADYVASKPLTSSEFASSAQAQELVLKTKEEITKLATAKNRGSAQVEDVADLLFYCNETLKELPEAHGRARRTVHEVKYSLSALQQQLARETKVPTSPLVVIPTDVLFQAYQQLFPAEKMQVTSGRCSDGHIVLGASFDVTGHSSTGGVVAHQEKLGQALIAMDKSDTQLAAWLHSHPGSGPDATTPSQIDVTQHARLVPHYPEQLIGIIFVDTGHFRLWGTALENQNVEVEFQGKGVTKESQNEHLYRLA